MAKLNNPFVVFGYKGGEYFCDREQETELIINALNNERNITLVAPRRMGKTGLIHHVFERINASQPDVRCFYIDLFPTKNLSQMVQMMARIILGQLDGPTQTVLRRVSKFFAAFRPTITFDEITGSPTISLDVSPGQERASLEQIIEYLKQSGRRCYIALDEFQQVATYNDDGVEALLRSQIQFLPNVYFIFSGSQQHMMEEMFTTASRPFFQSVQLMRLKPLDEEIYRDFANGFFAAQRRAIDAGLFHELFTAMRGITWNVHVVLNRLFEVKRRPITRDLVREIIGELVIEQEPVFAAYYDSFTANQALLIEAIARDGVVDKPLSQEFIARHRLSSASSVKQALQRLGQRQLVCKTTEGYVVYDSFFAVWLRGK